MKNRNSTHWIKEIVFLLVILLMMNISLITGKGIDNRLLFFPQQVFRGEWWRMLTSPFVHVSIYHLILDGSAFFILYAFLRHISIVARLGVCLGAVSGSMWFAWMLAPEISTIGLCGLSGVAHGLMAVSGVLMLERKEKYKGLMILFVIIGKSVIECITGNVIFLGMHSGECGIPVAGSHGGGVLGALAAYTVVKFNGLRGLGEHRWKSV